MVEVRADGDVGVEQEVGPPVIRGPPGIEEHVLARERRASPRAPEAGPPPRMAGTAGLGWRMPRKTRRSSGMRRRKRSTARSSDMGSSQLYTPPPHSTTLSSGPIPGTTPRRPGPPTAGRLARQPEGHHGDQLRQQGVAQVVVGVDPAQGAQGTEPEIALPFAGAGKEVAPSEPGVSDTGQTGHGPVLFCPLTFWPASSTHLQVFQVVGVVYIDRNGVVGFTELGCHVDERTGGEHDVGLVDQLPDGRAFGQAQLRVGMRA